MAQRPEELFAFVAARQLKCAAYALLEQSSAHQDYAFAAQVRSAAASIEANIAEGFHRPRRDFARFLLMARGSLGELETRLADGVHRRHYPQTSVDTLSPQFRLTATAIMRLRKHLLDTR